MFLGVPNVLRCTKQRFKLGEDIRPIESAKKFKK